MKSVNDESSKENGRFNYWHSPSGKTERQRDEPLRSRSRLHHAEFRERRGHIFSATKAVQTGHLALVEVVILFTNEPASEALRCPKLYARVVVARVHGSHLGSRETVLGDVALIDLPDSRTARRRVRRTLQRLSGSVALPDSRRCENAGWVGELWLRPFHWPGTFSSAVFLRGSRCPFPRPSRAEHARYCTSLAVNADNCRPVRAGSRVISAKQQERRP